MINENISIETMRKIFEIDAKIKCGVNEKMIYQNVLTHHFANKITNVHLLNSFSLTKEKLKYEKFKETYDNLEKAELIEIYELEIVFRDVWVKHINLTNFGQGECKRITAEQVKEELYESHSLNEIIRMKYKVTIKKATQLLHIFIKEQEAVQTQYHNESQIRKHFVYWCQTNLDKINTEEQVWFRSKSKILGKK